MTFCWLDAFLIMHVPSVFRIKQKGLSVALISTLRDARTRNTHTRIHECI